ncbi:MAG: TIGR00341 family protein [Bacteroidales bacterium]|nr:TIGR00341 family protein [Bacteroidales bacterium]MBN2758177.1 TIGR00341 family protein [Bacteroidales bacterium]
MNKEELENKTTDDKQTKSKIEAIRDLKSLYKSTRSFLIETLAIKDGIDTIGTIEGIKKDMIFKGHTVWILMASIFIASIGLNVNSTAVVIGAMLISPLMGPILAIGLSIGTNDWETLLKSLKNFGIAIVIALITSTIYFLISPLKEASPELLARTKPTILDVLIGIFGGFAGIVAGSRRERSNVVPGVAIATALMPPLCTAGYGLATAQLSYFFGAFYLFFINSVFISLSTLAMVRYLRFPKKRFINKEKETKIKKYIWIFIIIIIIPSAKIFLDVLKETRFTALAKNYCDDNLKFEGSELINQKITYSDTLSIIDIYLIGEELNEDRIKYLNDKLKDYGLNSGDKIFNITDKTILKVHQANDNSDTIFSQLDYISNNLSKDIKTGILEDIYKKNEEIIYSKDQQIKFLENKIVEFKKDSIPLKKVSKEIMIQYPKITKFGYAKTIEINSENEIDTIYSFFVKWNGYAWRAQKIEQEKILAEWLKVRLQIDTLRIVEFK